MQNRIAALSLLVICQWIWADSAAAQPAGRKPPKVSTNSAPRKPGASRVSEPEEDPAAKAATKPGARFASGAASSTESDDPTEAVDNSRDATVSPPISRFGNREEPSAEPDQAPEETAPVRREARTASLDDRRRSQGAPTSRKLLEQAQESSSDSESIEPTPLVDRGATRGVEEQAIQVSLNDSEAGLSLAFALNLDHAGAIKGYPIRMEQVLAASGDNSARRGAIRAYWNLVVSIADHHHALDEFDRVTQMAASSGDKLTEAAAAAAEARVAETKIIVTAAQFDLAAFTPSPATLPIPADAPLIGDYRTEFAALFGRGPAPLAIKRLSVMLPLYKDQVAARGRATIAISEAIDRSDDLQTFKQLCEHRRAFLSAVRDYNEAIADYALQLATPGMSAETVTSMLIVRAAPAADARPDLTSGISRGNREVIQASAESAIEHAPAKGAAVKPRPINRVREFESEEEPSESGEEDRGTLKSDPESSESGNDLSETKPGNWGGVRKYSEE